MLGECDSRSVDELRVTRTSTARCRAGTYRLLADMFNAEPTAEMLDSLRRPEAMKAFEVLGVTFAAQLDQMEANLGRDGVAEELACEYARLFIGPGKHVGPYESLHREDHPPEHWGPSTTEVKRFIEHHGLRYEENFKGMPDHISAEFQFISMLADVEADALEREENGKADQAREIQWIFHREHIVPWVPVFCDKVVRLADLDFYKNFACMTKDVVKVDAEELSTRL